LQRRPRAEIIVVSRVFDSGGVAVPRGKGKFGTDSPNSDLWPDDPEGAIREIADRHDVIYIEGSLVFAPGGKSAEALFQTEEPGEGDRPSQLFRLAEDLDAWEFKLLVDPERWQARRQGTG
jgi:hypothetical protein